MEIIYYASIFNGLIASQRNLHDNDNAPPASGTPAALPGPLPASIVFPVK